MPPLENQQQDPHQPPTEASFQPVPTVGLPTPPTEAVPTANGLSAASEALVNATLPLGSHEIMVIKRHPFGLVAMYLQAIIATTIALILLYVVVPSVLSGASKTRGMEYLSIFAVIAIALVAIFLIAATYIYRQSQWLVTDEAVFQTMQQGLFRRETSELSMANIEDVTANQRGALAELFNFGTIEAETAGEMPNFNFNYCPTPQNYAKVILDARERFINQNPAQAKRANETLIVPGV